MKRIGSGDQNYAEVQHSDRQVNEFREIGQKHEKIIKKLQRKIDQ